MRNPRAFATPTLPPVFGQEKLPFFALTFLTDTGPYNAYVKARNSQAATEEGIIELAAQFPDFDAASARLIRAVQTQ